MEHVVGSGERSRHEGEMEVLLEEDSGGQAEGDDQPDHMDIYLCEEVLALHFYLYGHRAGGHGNFPGDQFFVQGSGRYHYPA